MGSPPQPLPFMYVTFVSEFPHAGPKGCAPVRGSGCDNQNATLLRYNPAQNSWDDKRLFDLIVVCPRLRFVRGSLREVFTRSNRVTGD